MIRYIDRFNEVDYTTKGNRYMRLISKVVSEFASSYTYDSGANSIDKQMSGLHGYVVNGKSHKKETEEKEIGVMSNDLSESDKKELLRYRKVRDERLIKEGKSKGKKLRERLDKYRVPLPLRMKEDIKREKSLSSGSVGSEISPTI
jgi:hypothetical protein